MSPFREQPSPARVVLALALLIVGPLAPGISPDARADGPPPALTEVARSGADSSRARPRAVSPLQYGPASLRLSWRAPYGMPRATDRVVTRCDDTTRVDTLFVTFTVPRRTPGVDSLGVVLYFHPMGPDSLGPFWHFKRGWENQMNLMVDFDYTAGIEGELPWNVMGFGNVAYDHRSGRGRLDLGFTIPPDASKSLLPGVSYTCARIRIRQRRTDLGGCSQPVCIEASDLVIQFTTRRRAISSPASERFVGWNTPQGPCRPPVQSLFKPWRPK